jgi:ADP-heptose:LPS heptosyltransferase
VNGRLLKLPGTIILSRTDRLGDAVITTAMAGAIKRQSPATRVVVLIREMARPVWERCTHADAIVTLEELDAAGEGGAIQRLAALNAGAIVHVFANKRVASWARRAGIPVRIGSNRHLQHWWTCNRLVPITRKRSRLHEAQLGLQLLAPFGVPIPQPYQALGALMGLTMPTPTPEILAHLKRGRRNIILHPLSVGGDRWGLARFADLMALLDAERDHILLTGTAAEAALYRAVLPVAQANVTDLGGRLTVEELWQLIAASDALVACSTGPLHLAAAAGIRTVGIYGNFRAINPDRWGPIGRDAHALVYDPDCPTCAVGHCTCLTQIPASRVLACLAA